MIHLFSIVLSSISTVWSLWVTVLLWGWFALPFGLPGISMLQAFGIRALITALHPPRITDDDVRSMLKKSDSEKRTELAIKRSLLWMTFYLLLLVFGWIAKGLA